MPWELTGNVGTHPPADFLGTKDDQPLVIEVAGVPALRIEPPPAPNAPIQTTVEGSLHVNGPQSKIISGTDFTWDRRMHIHSNDWSNSAEIHASGTTGGFSFMNRDTDLPHEGGPGTRWVLFARGEMAHLWTNVRPGVSEAEGSRLAIDTGGNLHVGGAVRLQKGNSEQAGLLFPQGDGDHTAWIRYYQQEDQDIALDITSIDAHGSPNNYIALRATAGVGMGTRTKPRQALEVVGAIATTRPYTNANSNDRMSPAFVELWSDNAIIAHNSQPLRIGLASGLNAEEWSEKMRITPDGHVGIGTQTPDAGLHIYKGGTNDLALKLTSSGPGWGSGMFFENTAPGAKTYGIYSGSDGRWHFADVNNSVDRLVIDQAGNITATAGLRIDRGGTNEWAMAITSSGPGLGSGMYFANTAPGAKAYGIYSGSDGRWHFADAHTGADRLVINQAGNIGVGTPTPQSRLDVAGDIRLNDNTLYLRSSADQNHGIGWRSDFAGTRIDGPAIFGYGGGALGTTQGGQKIALSWNTAGDVTVRGDIFLTNADYAEEFDIATEAVEPGMVMVIDEAGALRPCEQDYDPRVAGVISGAGNMRPAITLDKQAGRDHRLPLALMGKVQCKVDATYGAVAVGDLLTTSHTPGYARKADHPASGTVIGKALGTLPDGQGLVPILVALQ